MPTKLELMAEADKRGILPPKQKRLYDEAVRRGLTKSKPNMVQSAIQGAAQGISANFGDNIMASLIAPVEWLISRGIDVEGLSEKSLADIYRKERDKINADNRLAADTNPISYGAGEVTGAVGGALAMPLGNAARAAQAEAKVAAMMGKPVAKSLGAAMISGAKTGAGYGALSGYGGSDGNDLESDIGHTLKGAAGGAAFGLAAAPIGRVAGYGWEKIVDLGQRLGAFKNVYGSADKLALRQFVEDYQKEGFTPIQIINKVSEIEKSLKGRSMAEALGSARGFQRERNVFMGNDATAREFRGKINESNKQALSPHVDELQKGYDNSEPLYGAAEREFTASKALEDAANQPPRSLPVNKGENPYFSTEAERLAPRPEVDPSKYTNRTAEIVAPIPVKDAEAALQRGLPEKTVDQQIDDILAGVKSRMEELQGIAGDTEGSVLPLASQRLANAARRGGVFKALQEARQQLRTLFVTGADEATANRANKISSGYAGAVGDIVSQRAPSFSKADEQFKRGLVSTQLSNAAQAGEGNLSKTYSKLPEAGPDRNNLLKMLPEDEGEALKKTLSAVKQVVDEGYGRGLKVPMSGNKQQMADEAGVPLAKYLAPLGLLQRTARTVGGVMQPEVYRAQKDLALGGIDAANTVANAMADRAVKQSDDPISRAVANGLAAAFANENQPPRKKEPLRIDIRPQDKEPMPKVNLPVIGPQSNASPLGALFAQLVGGGNSYA